MFNSAAGCCFPLVHTLFSVILLCDKIKCSLWQLGRKINRRCYHCKRVPQTSIPENNTSVCLCSFQRYIVWNITSSCKNAILFLHQHCTLHHCKVSDYVWGCSINITANASLLESSPLHHLQIPQSISVKCYTGEDQLKETLLLVKSIAVHSCDKSASRICANGEHLVPLKYNQNTQRVLRVTCSELTATVWGECKNDQSQSVVNFISMFFHFHVWCHEKGPRPPTSYIRQAEMKQMDGWTKDGGLPSIPNGHCVFSGWLYYTKHLGIKKGQILHSTVSNGLTYQWKACRTMWLGMQKCMMGQDRRGGAAYCSPHCVY